MNSPLHRRDFLKASLLAAVAPAVLSRALGGASAPGPIRREIFLPAPPRTTIGAATFYTRLTGTSLLSIHSTASRFDTVDVAYLRFSEDNGRTWGHQRELPTVENNPGGKRRRATRSCVVDPATGRLLRFWNEGTLPTDEPLEGMREWTVFYAISDDAGFSWYLSEEAIQGGPEFTPRHPFPGIWTGRNCIMIGDCASKAIVLSDGTFLLPVATTLIGPDGTYANPGGGYTYTQAAVLRGRWTPDRRRIAWELSRPVETDPRVSTRGTIEPTLAELPDGRILMVIRGANDTKPWLPGRRWVSTSADRGRTWARPVPWTYSSGEDFYSPSSASELVVHSSGRIFWLGNICPVNPEGDLPRHPMVIGEVDRRTGLLEKPSVRVVDDRRPGESAFLALSSPISREDRETGEIVLNMTRFFELSTATERNWTANAYLYRIPVA
jgi:hypothetical protein